MFHRPSFSTRPRALLGRMLAEITPGDLSRTFFTLGGTEANVAAVKICHQFTGWRKIISRYRSYHGATYAGHALACAAAVRVIQVYEEDGLIENADRLGPYLLYQTRGLMDRHPSVGEARGLGLFVGLELVKDRKTKEPLLPVAASVRSDPNPKQAVARRLMELGLSAMAAGPSNVIILAPPLIATRQEIDEGLAILDQALVEADRYVA